MSYPVPPEGLPQDPSESLTKEDHIKEDCTKNADRKPPLKLTRRDYIGLGCASFLSILWVLFADGDPETMNFSLEFFATGGIGFTICILATLAAFIVLRGNLNGLGWFTRSLLVLTALVAVVPSVSANLELRFANAFVLFILLLLDFLLVSNCPENIVLTLRGWAVSVSFFFRNLFAHFTLPYRAFRRRPIASERVKAVIVGVILAGSILIVVLPLLFSADAVFASKFDVLFDWDLGNGDIWLGRVIRLAIIIPIASSLFYAVIHALGKETTLGKKFKKPQLSNVLIATTLIIINAVYVFFVLIQITYLFGGIEATVMHGGYAQYARSGFFELVAVAAINLALTLLTICLRKRDEKGVFTSLLLYVLLVVTVVMLVSAVHRMNLYTATYGLSMLRAMTYMGMVAILALVIIAAVYIQRADLPVFKLGVACLSAIWLIFALSNPAARIADFNVDQYLSGSVRKIDIGYLRELGSDAVPSLQRLCMSEGQTNTGEAARDSLLCLEHRHEMIPWTYQMIFEMDSRYFSYR